ASSFRFFIEFFKEEQSVWLKHSHLTMGQWLSIPFILIGLFLFLNHIRYKSKS
ncbi:MAG: prolipoprotein diacylglyceryl transferase family protein, partial [Rhabdochlamydiaceae bacterium]